MEEPSLQVQQLKPSARFQQTRQRERLCPNKKRQSADGLAVAIKCKLGETTDHASEVGAASSGALRKQDFDFAKCKSQMVKAEEFALCATYSLPKFKHDRR